MMVGESNEPWLGKVPSKWAIRRIKDIAELKCGDGITSESITPVGDIPVFGGNGLRGYTTSFTHEGHYVLIGRQGALCGNINYAKGKFWASEHAVVASMIGKIDTYWLGELLRDMNLNQYSNAAAQPGLAVDRIKFLRMPVPPLEEQQRIAAYLDASCAAIDAAVAAKRHQLETLDALRKSIIQRAVTQGLNPQTKMKSAGLDWLCEVPAHWQVRQVKRMCSLVRGQFTHRPRNDPAFYDGPYPFVQTGDITAAGKYIRTYSQTLNELGLSVSKRFPRGTLVMSIAANIGDVAILDFEACFPDSMIGMVPGHKTNLDFLYYLMRAMRSIMLRSAVQSTQLNLNYVRIGTNFAPFPPLKEQSAIAEYLDEKERESHLISKTIESQIATLTAYRKSLIHECVTGQRRISADDVNRAKAAR